jgi:GNAT superfamily N-acetyltransferase
MLHVRPAEADDAAPVARVHVRSWQIGYRGLLPDHYLDGLRPEDRMGHYTFGSADPEVPHTLVALDEGVIRGFATTAPCRDAGTPEAGEVLALYVDPDTWGVGVGTLLIGEARHHLWTQGFSDAVLWVLAGNVRAHRFYQSDGWESDGLVREDVVWGAAVSESRFRRRLP